MNESLPVSTIHEFAARRLVTAFVDNAFLSPGSGVRLPVINPATELPVSEVEEAGAAIVDRAVRAARAAYTQGPWPRLEVAERQTILRRLAALIREHAQELAWLECLNSGIPMRHLALGQIPRAALNFEFFAEFIGQCAGQVYTQDSRYLTLVTREPIGVAALIGPWNAPLALTSMKIAGCIAFGNCCVAKPAEQTPLAVARLMDLIREAGVPAGVVNLVCGRGAVTGDALVRHPEVDLVSFTGGTGTGRTVTAAAAAGLKPCSLELGGKSANVIFASADIERALDGALLGIFSNNGQQCLAGSRILVERSIATDFIDGFVGRATKLRLGDPMDPATEIGPLAFRAHLERVLSYVEVARADGAELLTGGGRAGGFERGFYMQPTAVVAADNRSRICQEEIFGPFATFLIFDDVDQAISIANDSRFGLVAYLWTEHMPTALRVSRALRSGVVWVNTPMVRELRAPFGGLKDSGMGREGGSASMQFYTAEKCTTLPLGPVPMPRLGLG
jgi:5-carboxymethyl-2-hydroxymuconic-semialdehyde dehydrogenase/aminomuconate-semialdehyde/2-hydroxymuconate-6-semialdehyde dehydrogenase